MSASASDKVFDLLIVMDITGSMGSYLSALNQSLPEIIRVSVLTGCFARIGIIAYRDYCDKKVTEWSGWHSLAEATVDDMSDMQAISRQQLVNFAARLKPNGGGDWPEATKTALAEAHIQMRAAAETIVVLFSDAPPHTPGTGGENFERERKALTLSLATAPFADWIRVPMALQTGPKKARVFCVIQNGEDSASSLYTYLAHRTGGACFLLPDGYRSNDISALTLGILLAWMGVGKDPSIQSQSQSQSQSRSQSPSFIGDFCRYREPTDQADPQCETDAGADRLWNSHAKATFDVEPVAMDGLGQHVTARQPPMQNLSQRYRDDPAYRTLVTQSLGDIITADVASVTLNPVFGSLWRTVCSDRANEARNELVALFSSRALRVDGDENKQRLKAWLEESYNFAGEIEALIASVPLEAQYPCVLLDPTLDFSETAGGTADGEEAVDHAAFTRSELLEIGRSCDPRILRRLGRVLTRLTFVRSAAELPAHLASNTATADEPGFVPRIPVALAGPAYKRAFWKVLLHAVFPGTKLAARPAALLAALSLRMGILSLQASADAELLASRHTWNSLIVPETWNASCLALLLAADSDYERRVRDGTTVRPTPDAAVLSPSDRRLFVTLIDYRLAEANLATNLTARVGWQPSKTQAPTGPMAVCTVCHFPRSVTVMTPHGVCGLCDDTCTCATPEMHTATIREHVRLDDTAATSIAWVECCVKACRSQYVVYNTDHLRVRPKCFYCRQEKRLVDSTAPTTAPFVECRRCLSRVIWPLAYRAAAWDAAAYECPACEAGVQTIVDVPTTAAALVAENGRDWLLRNDGCKIAAPFAGATVFSTVSAAGIDSFADSVEVLPPSSPGSLQLSLQAKRIRNADDLVAELRGWIQGRRTQREACSLCFDTLPKKALLPACGRHGCSQRVCRGCHVAWYGINRRGRIINVAALCCPFCRRQPSPKSIASLGLNTLGDLRRAVDQAGTTIFAWCDGCGFAKEFAERVCVDGAPAEVDHWRCEPCLAASKTTPAPAIRVMNCPQCETPTEKLGGCNHIACTVCGMHWCFACGVAVPENKIYAHMDTEHGGWYVEEGTEDDE